MLSYLILYACFFFLHPDRIIYFKLVFKNIIVLNYYSRVKILIHNKNKDES